MLGNGRLEAYCFDGVTRLGHIRGKMRKKVWVGAGDIILVSLREYQDGKVDIIHKYNADEARSLKAYGELPESARINETTMDVSMDADEDDIGFVEILFNVEPLAITQRRPEVVRGYTQIEFVGTINLALR